MAEAIRVLHVFGTTNLGGAESRVMDLYRSIDRTKVQFDFVTHSSKEGHFDKEILGMGGRIFHVPPFRVYNVLSYKSAFRKLFLEHPEFKVVHGHMTSTASLYLPIAKKEGIRTTVAHARSAGVDQGVKGHITKLLRRKLYKKADMLFACSELAGKEVFGKKAWEDGKVQIIPNAIKVSRFIFNPQKRQEMRTALGVSDNYVIGHVGSFRYAKNHEFLLQVFRYLPNNAVLLLLGTGELMEQVKTLAIQLKISDRVRFLGNRDNIEDYYQAMDFFVFPSRYEGLPGSVVEAQSAGLKCIISDSIAEEICFTDLAHYMSLKEKPEKWAEYIVENAEYERKNYCNTVVAKGFDISAQALQLTSFYETGEWI